MIIENWPLKLFKVCNLILKGSLVEPLLFWTKFTAPRDIFQQSMVQNKRSTSLEKYAHHWILPNFSESFFPLFDCVPINFIVDSRHFLSSRHKGVDPKVFKPWATHLVWIMLDFSQIFLIDFYQKTTTTDVDFQPSMSRD